jgi:hypothetical protein
MIKNLTVLVMAGLLSMAAFHSAAKDKDEGPDEALTIDRTSVNPAELNFPNDDNTFPKISDFEVLNFVLMSTYNGERWATVTLRNKANGSRKLQRDHIMALFADGRRRAPANFNHRFEGKEVLSFTLSFGQSKFPVLSVYTRDN